MCSNFLQILMGKYINYNGEIGRCVFFRDEPAAAAKITRQFKLELVHNMLVKVHFLTLRYYQNI